MTTLAEVTRILAAVDPAIAQVPQAHYLFVDVLAVWGSAQQRERLFGDVLAGARIGNALAERGGQHAQDLKVRIAGGVLDGTKYYCTGALTARWIAVSALDDDGRLVAAFVARDAPGVAVDRDWDVLGQRATISGTVRFDAVALDPGLVLDYARAYEVPQQLGARAQLVHAAIEVGIAGGALRDTRTYLREKARPSTEAVRAGAAVAADDPHVLHRYGRAATRVRAAEALLADAAAVLDEIGLRAGRRRRSRARVAGRRGRQGVCAQRSRSRSPASSSSSAGPPPRRPSTTSTATGATPAPTASTIRWTGSTTTSPPMSWRMCCRPITASSSPSGAARTRRRPRRAPAGRR